MEKKGVEYHENQEQCCGDVRDKQLQLLSGKHCNTQAMAEAVGAGITKAGKEADVVEVSGASMEDLKAAKVFALGCPAMGAEVLEEDEFEPFFASIEESLNGKTKRKR